MVEDFRRRLKIKAGEEGRQTELIVGAGYKLGSTRPGSNSGALPKE